MIFKMNCQMQNQQLTAEKTIAGYELAKSINVLTII